jgi:hypothetical protein
LPCEHSFRSTASALNCQRSILIIS